MSEVSLSNNLPSIESLQRGFEALKEGGEELKGVDIKRRIGGKIPETKDLWFKVVQLKPKPLSTTYLYGVAHTLIRLQDLEDQLDLYEKKESSDRKKLAIPSRILRSVADGRTSRGELLQILHSTVRRKPLVKAKKEIPIDWPLRQKELGQRYRANSQGVLTTAGNWLSRWWRGEPVSYSPIGQNWVCVFLELTRK